VQRAYTSSGAVDTTTTALPPDDTIPQNTEGKQAFSLSITPTSAAHVMRIRSILYCAGSADGRIANALFQDSGADAISTGYNDMGAVNVAGPIPVDHQKLAGTTSSVTFAVRYGSGSGTITLNGFSSARKYGGVLNSFLEVEEFAT
jgi:hypothetical protein